MSGSANDFLHANNLSHSDFGQPLPKKQPISTIPKTYVQLLDDNSNSKRLNLRKQKTSSRERSLGVAKKFELIVHSIKMQISSRIDLQLVCQLNNSSLVHSSIRRVDQVERTAKFDEEKLQVDLAKVKGRSRKNALNVSASDMSQSHLQSSEISSVLLEGGE